MSNVGFRLIFPFLPAISRGLGVSLSTLGSAVAVRNLSSVAAPLIGRLVDARPYRRVVSAALIVMAFSVLLAGLASGIVLFTAAITLVTLAKYLCDTAAGSWLGLHVPFARRGRVVGLTELSWALAFLVAMPILGLVIRAGTWRTAFVVVAVGLVLTSLFVARSLPQQAFEQKPTAPVGRPGPALLPAMMAALIFSVGHQAILVTFASWLEDTHAVSISGLGMVALVLGGAELTASLAGIGLIDRVGKARGFGISSVGLVPAGLALTIGDNQLALAVVLLAAVFVFFEYAFISILALFTELDPNSRGSSISWGLAALGIGHALGSIVGPVLYESGGIASVGFGIAAFSGVGAAIMFIMVKEPTT